MNTAVFEGILFPNFVLGFKSGFQAPQRASNKTLIKGGQVFYFSYLFLGPKIFGPYKKHLI